MSPTIFDNFHQHPDTVQFRFHIFASVVTVSTFKTLVTRVPILKFSLPPISRISTSVDIPKKKSAQLVRNLYLLSPHRIMRHYFCTSKLSYGIFASDSLRLLERNISSRSCPTISKLLRLKKNKKQKNALSESVDTPTDFKLRRFNKFRLSWSVKTHLLSQ